MKKNTVGLAAVAAGAFMLGSAALTQNVLAQFVGNQMALAVYPAAVGHAGEAG